MGGARRHRYIPWTVVKLVRVQLPDIMNISWFIHSACSIERSAESGAGWREQTKGNKNSYLCDTRGCVHVNDIIDKIALPSPGEGIKSLDRWIGAPRCERTVSHPFGTGRSVSVFAGTSLVQGIEKRLGWGNISHRVSYGQIIDQLASQSKRG